ncbi:MAG: hypothetical protein R3255_03335 [Candidatus Lokiarchaeia archaeon]|nr:hypothetical protein [Candidatus Lokiarchaeia archaeon]
MRNEIEHRLHRVMIKLEKKNVACPNAVECGNAENSSRCNFFYRKCTIFTGQNTILKKKREDDYI